MSSRWVRLFIILFCLAPPLKAGADPAPLPQDKASAVILAYHRVGEDSFPATSIRREQFEAHINELVNDSYNILPLPQIVEALKQETPLPEKTVAITFDGGYRSAYENAMPLLLRNNIPFTLFISPGQLKQETPQFINQAELKKLARNRLVTVGLHPDSYTRLHGLPDAEIRRQVNNAITRYRELLEQNPELFAYPFGEYSLSYRNIVEAAGFETALGQHSGTAHAGSDLYSLPRFALTESYGDLDRFRLVANALPLPVSDVHPADPWLASRQPAIGFTIDNALADKTDLLSCFSSQKLIREKIGGNRIELRPARPFEGDRARINCTLPAAADPEEQEEVKSWRWFGLLVTFRPDL